MELWTYSSTLLMLINLKVLLGAGRTDNVMKTKALFLSFVALLMSATLSAQTIIKGDMNDDDQVTIADVTSLVNVILGKAPQETINVGGGSPYAVDNSMVVGTWYAPDGTSFEFNADGTTTFPDGATYEFMPVQGRLLVYDAASQPVKVLPILKAESEFLLTVDYATNLFTYYTKSNPRPQAVYYSYVGTDKNELIAYAATGELKPDIATQIPSIPGVKTYTSVPSSLEAGIIINAGQDYVYVIAPTETLNNATIYLVNQSNMTVVTETLGTFSIGSTEYTVKCTPSEVGTVLTAWKK